MRIQELPGKEADLTVEELKSLRKKASQFGLLLGGFTLALGAIVCLIYILFFKPWEIKSPQKKSVPSFSHQ